MQVKSWLSGTASTFHAESPRFNPRHVQVQVGGDMEDLHLMSQEQLKADNTNLNVIIRQPNMPVSSKVGGH